MGSRRWGGGERGPRLRPAAALRPDTSAAAAGPVIHPRILGVFEAGAALLRSSELKNKRHLVPLPSPSSPAAAAAAEPEINTVHSHHVHGERPDSSRAARTL